MITKKTHINGASRCLEALQLITQNETKAYDVIVDIQGDKPLLNTSQVTSLISCFGQQTKIVASAKKVNSCQEFCNSSECFVVINNNDNALYFS